ncbi:hypothetical protein AGLY_013124 [Aphis glycines]|uniref:Uncharacterized protein n=1 Tax=Aphis glycines TaxID=307491 RepID=A0A6G0T624_APHGL|nr:hypothetical protein AGLY_013124 [Aphis glycines]
MYQRVDKYKKYSNSDKGVFLNMKFKKKMIRFKKRLNKYLIELKNINCLLIFNPLCPLTLIKSQPFKSKLKSLDRKHVHKTIFDLMQTFHPTLNSNFDYFWTYTRSKNTSRKKINDEECKTGQIIPIALIVSIKIRIKLTMIIHFSKKNRDKDFKVVIIIGNIIFNCPVYIKK